MKLSKHPSSSSVGKKEQKKSAEKRRYSITRGQGNFDVILEDEPLSLPDSDNLSDYYEVAPERLEVVGLPPEDSTQKKDRSLSLGALAGSLNLFKRFSNGNHLPSDTFSQSPPKYSHPQQIQGLLPKSNKRRESFLYRPDSEGSSTPRSLSGPGEVSIVTPFAQILQSLRAVRSNHVNLTSRLDRCREQHGKGKKYSNKTDDTSSQLCMDTLDELDWCLGQLESMDSSSSVSNMATNKFKQMLNKELLGFSESSKSGNQIADFITSTYYDKPQDFFENEPEEPEVQPVRYSGIRKGSIMNHVTAGQDISALSLFKEEMVPTMGVFSSKPAQLAKVLSRIDSWGLDVFTANEIIKDQRVLTCTTFKIFQERDLLKTFKIPPKTLLSFLMTLEDHYLKDVSYHNHLHASDVTQSTHVLLQSSSLQDIFSPLEILSALLACCVHDVDHPGVSNQFLVNTSSELAVMYNDESVLENHHCAVAFKLLQTPECDILSTLTKKQRTSVRKMVIDMVLATDMSKHMSMLANLKTMVETKKLKGTAVFQMENYSDKIKILQNMVHCCDLSNPTKPQEQYVQWVDRLMEEFWVQGDKERELGLDMSPMCDRSNATVEKSQVGFIDYVVHPLWEVWAELVFPDAQDMLALLEKNRSYYEVRIPIATPPSNEDNEPFEEVLAFEIEDLKANLKSRSFSVDF